MRPVKIGVPQESILGPLHFILFINDLPSQLSHSESTMFADDNTALTEGFFHS
jgi:sarcosine oxidase/L-pipecolate oxidase